MFQIDNNEDKTILIHDLPGLDGWHLPENWLKALPWAETVVLSAPLYVDGRPPTCCPTSCSKSSHDKVPNI